MTSGIIEILIGNPLIQLTVGLNAKGDKYKVYPMVCPQPEDQPYIVVEKTGNTTRSMGKEIHSTLDYTTYNVLCYGKNFRKTEELNEAVRAAIDNVSALTTVCAFERIWLMTDFDRFANELDMYVHVAQYGAEITR
jgi:hypothetical protein